MVSRVTESVGVSAQPLPSQEKDARPQVGTAQEDTVLFLGMNDGAKDEVQFLEKRGVAVTRILSKPLTLSTRSEVADKVRRLRLPELATAQLVEALWQSPELARDELLQLAVAFSKPPHPTRMVLSGHSVGSGVWGDDNGFLSWTALEILARIFPKAAQAMEDVHLSACYSGGEKAVERFRGIFPNLKTFWAYEGSAPGSASGATTHLGRWEKATLEDTALLTRESARGTRKGEEVAVWSLHGGYEGKNRVPIDDLRALYSRQQSVFEDFFWGHTSVRDSQAGPLREYYGTLQRLLQHPALSSQERSLLESQRDVTLRLLYFSPRVTEAFQRHHEGLLRDAFTELKLRPPDFSRQSRREVLETIAQFENHFRQSLNTSSVLHDAHRLLTEGLRDLNTQHIPIGWV